MKLLAKIVRVAAMPPRRVLVTFNVPDLHDLVSKTYPTTSAPGRGGLFELLAAAKFKFPRRGRTMYLEGIVGKRVYLEFTVRGASPI